MPTDDRAAPTEADLDHLFETLSNWGRWGDDDEAGALNHQTAAHRVRATGLVRDGEMISLAHDLAVQPSVETPFPAHHHMLTSGDALDANGLPGYEACGDYIGTQVHGLGLTHVDALSHMFVRGQMYNGRPASEVRSTGALRNTVMTLSDGLMGRGVLLDIPALHGVEFVEAEVAIDVADLEAAEAAAGLTVGPGDFLMVSTGRDAADGAAPAAASTRSARGWPDSTRHACPGCTTAGVAVLGGDGISDRMPFGTVPNWPFPIHQIGITVIGLHLIDNMHLEPLAMACAERRRWEALLTVNVLRIPGGTGCPVNPVASL